MASNLSWSLGGHILTVEVLKLKQKISFDLSKLFPEFDKYTEVQQKAIANGVKQKLADHCARTKDVSLTPAEMVIELKDLWERLLKGQWNKPGVGKETMKKKVSEAVAKATPEELKVLKKLGLV